MKRGSDQVGNPNGSPRNGHAPAVRPEDAEQQRKSKMEKEKQKNKQRLASEQGKRKAIQGVDGRPQNLGNTNFEENIMSAITHFLNGDITSPTKSAIKTAGTFKGGEFMGYSASPFGSRHVIALVCFYSQSGWEFVFFTWEKKISGDKVQTGFTQIIVLNNVPSQMYRFQPSTASGVELLELLINRLLEPHHDTKTVINNIKVDSEEWWSHFATCKFAVENSTSIEDGLRVSLMVVGTMSLVSPMSIGEKEVPAGNPLTVCMTLIHVSRIDNPSQTTPPKLLNWLVVYPELMVVGDD